jgi:hypothetical protein
MQLDQENGLLAAGPPHLQRLVASEADSKVYEQNIHKTMSNFLELRAERQKDMYNVFKLISEADHARERRQKVFQHFRSTISRENNFQTGTVYEVTHEVLVLIDGRCCMLYASITSVCSVRLP